MMVAAPCCDGILPVGIVCQPALVVPPVGLVLPRKFPRYERWGRALPSDWVGELSAGCTHLIPLRLGDVITHIEGHPIPNLKILNELTQKPGIGVPFVIAGDPIRVGVQRGGEDLGTAISASQRCVYASLRERAPIGISQRL